jgi:hypothetical protein
VKPARIAIVGLALIALASCEDKGVPGYDSLSRHVAKNRVGVDADQWIEMLNLEGKWERTGLIFGYIDDYGECVKVIEGFKRANPARDYRCVPAN